MRNIKFRVWDKNKREFLNYPCYFNHLDFNEFTCFDRYFFGCEEEGIIVQQSTELLDKDGKEIFEGDIIIFMGKWDEKGTVIAPDFEPHEVAWCGGGFYAFPLSIAKQLDSSGRHVKGVGHTDNKVIGNIMENPELLKKK